MNFRKFILGLFIFSGMTTLIYEVVWVRPLQLIFGSTIYAISTILIAFFVGFALGSYLISKKLDELKNPALVYAFIEIAVGIYAILLLFILKILPGIYGSISFLRSNFYLFSLAQFVTIFFVLLIPTTLMGATFPIVAKIYSKDRIGKSIGEVYSVSNIGAIIGSFVAGFILIPFLGIKLSIIFAGSINIAVAALIMFRVNKKNFSKIVSVVLILFIALSFLSTYNIEYLHFPKEIVGITDFLYYKEGLSGTVVVTEDPILGPSLFIDGKGQGSLGIADLRVNYLLAYLPQLLKSDAGNALVIGLGTGATSGHLANSVKTTTVEIEKEVIGATEYFKVSNLNVLENPNHEIIIDDARNYLVKNNEKYDIIAQQPSDPWTESSANLFSKEFFELIKEDLDDDGLYLTWSPIYTMTPEDFRSYYKTFSAVFPNIIVFANINENEEIPFNSQAGELVFIGSENEIDYEKLIEENFDSLSRYSKGHLGAILLNSPEDILNLLMFTNKELSGYGENSKLITDNNLLLEFSTAKNFFVGNSSEVILDINKYIQNEQ